MRTYSVILQRPDLDLALMAVTLGPRYTWSSSGGELLVMPGLFGSFLRRLRNRSEESPDWLLGELEAELEAERLHTFDVDLRTLDLELLSDVRAEDLARAVLAAAQGQRGLSLRFERWGRIPFDTLASAFVPRDTAEVTKFAEYVAYAPVIPVESSPLSGKSLGELVTGVGGSAVLVSTGHDPLLLVKAGLGVGGFIVIVGTARAVTAGVEHWIKRWFRVEEDAH